MHELGLRTRRTHHTRQAVFLGRAVLWSDLLIGVSGCPAVLASHLHVAAATGPTRGRCLQPDSLSQWRRRVSTTTQLSGPLFSFGRRRRLRFKITSNLMPDPCTPSSQSSTEAEPILKRCTLALEVGAPPPRNTCAGGVQHFLRPDCRVREATPSATYVRNLGLTQSTTMRGAPCQLSFLPVRVAGS